MNSQSRRVFLISILIGTVAGCASQGGRPDPGINPFCAVVGGVVGGGAAAAISLAAGPIGAGVGVGALLGALACRESAPRMAAVAQNDSVTRTPMPAPATVAADPDSDGDSVVDSLDRCPGTPPGTRVDAHGCPDVLLTLTGINFKFDSAVIDAASSDILERAVASLGAAPDVAVRIEGHCDSVGTDDYNLALSQRRAEAVSAYLVAHGVNASRLTAVGMGEAQPVAPNDSEQGRFQNRRVELHVETGAAGTDSRRETWRDVDHSVNTRTLDDTSTVPR